MYSTRLIHLLMLALSFITVAQASWLDFGFVGKAKNEFVARQADPTTSSSSSAKTTSSKATSSSTSQATTSSADPTTDAPTTATPTPTTTPTTTTPTTSQANPVTTPTTTSQPSSTPTGGDNSATTSDPATTDAPSSEPTTSATPFTTLIVTTVTESNGNVVTSSSSAVVTPTGLTTSSTSSGDNAGMSTGTRNTIIGVCVGVGGAIVLAVAGLLFWRLRRKRQQEDNEDLVTYGAGTSQFNSGPEKSEASGSLTGRSPFQSTLESYHAPTQSNTGTNF